MCTSRRLALCALMPVCSLLANVYAHVLALRSNLNPRLQTEVLGVFEDAVLFNFLCNGVGSRI